MKNWLLPFELYDDEVLGFWKLKISYSLDQCSKIQHRSRCYKNIYIRGYFVSLQYLKIGNWLWSRNVIIVICYIVWKLESLEISGIWKLKITYSLDFLILILLEIFISYIGIIGDQVFGSKDQCRIDIWKLKVGSKYHYCYFAFVILIVWKLDVTLRSLWKIDFWIIRYRIFISLEILSIWNY